MNLPTWEQLYPMLPVSIKKIFLKLQQIKENPEWHPEDNALEHIKLVYDKTLKTNDPDMVMSALFHDLGKAFTAKLKPEGYSSSHGHEEVSTELSSLPQNKEFMEKFGADPETVIWIVKNHMRIKLYNEMRKGKKLALQEHPAFKKLTLFSELDKAAKNE